MKLFTLHIIVKIRINRHTRAKTLYKLIYRGKFHHAFFLFACEWSFETASFCLKFWLFSSRWPRKLILSIFSKSKQPFEKQTTPRLITHLYLSMDKIWAKMIFWLWPRNFEFARFLQTFALKIPKFQLKLGLHCTNWQNWCLFESWEVEFVAWVFMTFLIFLC